MGWEAYFFTTEISHAIFVFIARRHMIHIDRLLILSYVNP